MRDDAYNDILPFLAGGVAFQFACFTLTVQGELKIISTVFILVQLRVLWDSGWEGQEGGDEIKYVCVALTVYKAVILSSWKSSI